MSAADVVLHWLPTVLLVAAAVASITVAFVFTRRNVRQVQEDAAKVQEDARKLQDQAESMMQGSTPHAVIVDECQEADDVDQMIEAVIEESARKRRKVAREMRKRQRKIERELAE